jgi:Tol biopolymer transport system component
MSVGLRWFATRRTAPPSSLTPIPVTSYLGDEWAGSFSPDEKQVTYAWNGEQQDNFDVYIERIGSGQRIRMTTDPGTDSSPVWAPDGRSIAFMRGAHSGFGALWVVSLETGVETKITDTNTPAPAHSRSLDWSPDSKWIVVSDRESPLDRTSLFLVSATTGERVRLTRPSTGQEDVQPAFSHDGRRIVFARDIGRGVSLIAVLALDGHFRPTGPPKHLELKDFERAGNSHPRWLAGGAEILFVSDRGGSPRLWRVSSTGGDPALVASAGEGAALPVLSRTATKLAYTQGTFDTNIWKFALADTESGRAAHPQILISSTRLEHNPHLSPDGRKVAFESNRGGYTEVWTSNVDGTNAAAMSDFKASVTGSPQWAPDGKQIAFDSRVEGQPELYVRRSGTHESFRLTQHPSADVVPRWSRDGQWIYFASNRTGAFQVWKVPASGGEPVQVTVRGGFAAAESYDAKTLFYTKSRSDVTELWKWTKEGGEQGPVLSGVVDRSFAVAKSGIYFLSSGPPASIQYMSLLTGKSTTLGVLKKPVHFGISLSADGQMLLYGQIDQQARDLMLIENFQ